MQAAATAAFNFGSDLQLTPRPPGEPRRPFAFKGNMNSLKTLTAALVLGLAVALFPVTHAQDTTGRIPTVTRLVKIFLDREGELLDAMRGKDAAAVERQLADDFELRVGHRPGVPIPRADFVGHVRAETIAGYSIEQMAVHEIGTTAIVSFMLRPEAGRVREGLVPLFVVDTWTGGIDNYRLRVRYVAPGVGAKVRIPGAGAEQPQIPKKY
jgi:hypothetical protein